MTLLVENKTEHYYGVVSMKLNLIKLIKLVNQVNYIPFTYTFTLITYHK